MIDHILRDRYRIIQRLGQGTFGSTYQAQDLNWPEPRFLAIKQLCPQFQRQGQQIHPADLLVAKEYFDREAAKLAVLDPYDQIPRLIERFEEGGEFFIVMDYVEGATLNRELVPGAPWSEEAVVKLIRDLLEPLAMVHRHQLIHRDVKPANVMRRRRDDRLVLIDFGGVKEVGTAEYSQARFVPRPPTLWIGTLAYVAPEQADGTAKYSSDLYSVGVIALEALLGCSPLEIPGDRRVGVLVSLNWPEIQRRAPMSDRLNRLLRKMTDPDWQRRYANAQEALKAIESLFGDAQPVFGSEAPTLQIGSSPPPLPIVPPREGLRTQLKRWLLGDQEPDPAPAKPQPRSGSTWVPAPAAKEPRPTVIATPQPPRPVDPFAGWRLREWSFETVRVDRRGRVVKRLRKTARSHFVDLGGGVKLEMVAIPGGQFQMGSPKTELQRFDTEGPVRTVTVSPLLMSRSPITVEQWGRVAGIFPAVLNPRLNIVNADHSKWKDATGPVEQVSWFAAMEFCARLSKATDRLYRLPSEAEWEYACRAGTQTPFAFGETLRTDLANYNGNYTYADGTKGEWRGRTTPVGQFSPNGFGLQDMHGNVWEWCLDDWHENYQNAPVDSRPWFNNSIHEQVFMRQFQESRQMNNGAFQKLTDVDNEQPKLLRGGPWFNHPKSCRSANRFRRRADYCYDGVVGFRVVVLP
jgi:formylglycine-generating enzyme required for sulfatase activity/serine/threonine protein kinase